MSMRLFPEHDFFKELERHGFKRKGLETANAIIFTKDDKDFVIRKGRANYPDFMIDRLLEHARGDCDHGADVLYFTVNKEKD